MNIMVEAKKRVDMGKGYARRLRKQGLIPGVFYEKGKEALPLVFDKKKIQFMINHSHGLMDLKIEGEKNPRKCVVKEVQYDPVTDEVIHLDFQGVTMGEKLVVTVPLVLKGTPAGVKAGGILEHLIHELEIECYPKDLPEELELDVSHLNLGDSIHIKDLHFENIRILDDPSEVVVLVAAPKVMEVEEAAVEEGEEMEPQVITGKKEEAEGEEGKTPAQES